jgi:hypothetical protein
MAGSIEKIVKFTIPINNKLDKHIYDKITGNSLDEIESTAITMANDYARKNADEKDPNKPMRFEILDNRGNVVINWVAGQWGKLTDVLEDKNDETGTPVNKPFSELSAEKLASAE